MKITKESEVLKLEDGKFIRSVSALTTEKELSIIVGGRNTATASLSPSMEREFVAGYLLGMGLIRGAADIVSIEITDESATVRLKDEDILRIPEKKTAHHIASGEVSPYQDTGSFSPVQSGIRIRREDILLSMNMLFEKTSPYRQTGGIHSAALFNRDIKPICIAEDIGRHNAVDKVIGNALLKGTDFAETFLVFTGRLAGEIAKKVCRAGIPVIATKSAVTDMAVETGKKCGITIIGFVRDRGNMIYTDNKIRIFDNPEMKIYSGAERVL